MYEVKFDNQNMLVDFMFFGYVPFGDFYLSEENDMKQR